MLNKLGKEVILFDGAMGSMIQKLKPKFNGTPELLNITDAELIKKIHQSYSDAGANIITTNTFGANNYKLVDTQYTVEEVISAAIDNAVAGGDHSIALDIGPIGKALEPVGDLTFDQAYELFKEQVLAADDRTDLILIETMSSLLEAKAAILAVKEHSELPVFVTMTIEESGRTLMGNNLENIAITLTSLNVDAIGLNCSFGPEGLYEPIKTILKYTDLPVMIQPNAGLPTLVDNITTYDYPMNQFYKDMKKMITAGVGVIGGCCGTTPQFIKQLSALRGTKVKERKFIYESYATGRSKIVRLGNKTTIIGERINPTGKPVLKQAIIKNDIDYILNEAIEQIDHGAEILDVNLGLPEVNESEKYKLLIPELQMVSEAPLQIDTSDLDALEAALRVYEGRPIINSVNGKNSSLKKILPLAKKYGALIIGLTLDEDGLPNGLEGRKKIGKKIIEEAKNYNIREKDILIDCVTLSISTHQKDLNNILNAIKYFKTNYNVNTTLGASNISFGLPNRDLLNTTFLTMALTSGLDAPITDPTVKEIHETMKAYKALSGQDNGCEDFINTFHGSVQDEEVKDQSTDEAIETLIIKGLAEETVKATKKLLKEKDPMEIVNNHLIKALDIIGDKYDREEIFLPQLMKSANCVKEAFVLIKKEMKGQYTSVKGKIILATVEGDIHDIGKNIVKVLLENYGFDIIDLGKNVKKERILKTIKNENIKLVGLSALMTTTVRTMEETIKLIKAEVPNCKVFVGGAVLTEDYAKKIGADYYCKDGQASVGVANQVFG